MPTPARPEVRTILLDETCANVGDLELKDWRGQPARLHRLRRGESLPPPESGAVVITRDPSRVAEAAAAGTPAFALHKDDEEELRASIADVLARPHSCKNCRRNRPGAQKFVSKAAKAAPDPVIDGLLAQVSEQNLGASVRALENFGTRYALAPNITAVTDHVAAAFRNAGYSGNGQVKFQPFPFPGSTTAQRNVLCSTSPIASTAILVCAHYDSTSENPLVSAPGADDNATGIAVLLETARLLRNVALQKPILFAAFGGEEEGLYGSTQCAKVASTGHWPLKLVVNMDMIGWQGAQDPDRIDIEYDMGNTTPVNDGPAKAAALRMAQAAADYTTLAPFHSDIDRSDYMPFEARRVPCIGIYEGDENPNYHTTGDVSTHLQTSHLARITRMLAAFLVREAR